MECTFKPRINHRRYSQKFLNDGSTSRFEQLFLDAENRRRRQAEYTQWYPEGLVLFELVEPSVENRNWARRN